MRSYMLTLFHGAPTGRLLVHDPSTGATEVLAEGLWFANGVALAPDESYMAVVETPTMRVLRRWLTGPKVRPARGQGWGSEGRALRFGLAAVGKSGAQTAATPNPTPPAAGGHCGHTD